MRRRPFAWLLVVLPIAVGCVHFTHKPPDDCLMRPADTVPDESKACVYIFLFDSYNPVGGGNLVGVRDHLHKIGFGKTYYGWPHHMDHFLSELQMVAAERPNARFAVIGSGHGAAAARRFTLAATEAGAKVDVVIYLEPRGLVPWEGEETATGTIVLRAEDLKCKECAPRHVSKASVATHPETLDTIERELTLMAMSVPPPPRPKAMRVNLVPPMPAPRQNIPIPKELTPDWQFLRPRHPWETPPPAPVYGGETLPYPRIMPDLPPPREVIPPPKAAK